MNLALFDFDGTITASDTWTPFMRFAVRPGRMLAGQVVLAPVVVGYRLGIVSASLGRQIAARAGFQGEEAAAVRQLGVQYAATVLPGTLRPSALDRIEWHRSQGDDIVVVSASLDVYLGPWCEGRGLDCICTRGMKASAMRIVVALIVAAAEGLALVTGALLVVLFGIPAGLWLAVALGLAAPAVAAVFCRHFLQERCVVVPLLAAVPAWFGLAMMSSVFTSFGSLADGDAAHWEGLAVVVGMAAFGGVLGTETSDDLPASLIAIRPRGAGNPIALETTPGVASADPDTIPSERAARPLAESTSPDALMGMGDDERFDVRLAQTIAWCDSALREWGPGSLRSKVLEGEPDFYSDRRGSAAVHRVASARQRLLAPDIQPARSPADLGAGRLLVYVPDENLACGAADVATEGFFDTDNVPPWDTWIGFFHDGEDARRSAYLVSWVPPVLVDVVRRGIDVNPEGCIAWLDDAPTRVTDTLRAAGVLPAAARPKQWWE